MIIATTDSFFGRRAALYFFPMKHGELLITLMCIIFAAALYLTIRDPKTHADESIHYNEVSRLIVGNMRINSDLTTFPTYHYVLALPGKIHRAAGQLPYVRFFAFCLSALSILVFFRIAQNEDPASAQIRTLQFCSLPILFPLFFLIYTDLFSLAFVLASLHLARRGQYVLAGLAAIGALATRQNNLMWVLLSCFFIFQREKSILLALRKGWVFVLLLAAFGIFIWFNHGIAIGDRERHPWGLFTGNIFFMLLLFFIFFLPIHVSKAAAIWGFLKKHKVAWLMIPLLYFVYVFSFAPTHPYNQATDEFLFFLRNRLLAQMNASLLWKSLFFLPMIYALFTLFVTPLIDRQYYWIYPTSILFVLPSWLIEQRYYLIPFSLFLLSRQRDDSQADYVMLAINIPVAFFLLYGITANKFFL
jgi:alpha-1,2-glucosyltransferase